MRSLDIWGLQYSAELLAPLTGLAGLRHLHVCPAGDSAEGLEVVCQLTGLRQLEMRDPSEGEGLLLQLTHLRQLTHLDYDGHVDGVKVEVALTCQVSWAYTPRGY